MMSDIARRFGDWIERLILGKIPGYNAIKSLTKGFASSQEEDTFKPALLNSANGDKEFVYIVEEIDDNLGATAIRETEEEIELFEEHEKHYGYSFYIMKAVS